MALGPSEEGLSPACEAFLAKELDRLLEKGLDEKVEVEGPLGLGPEGCRWEVTRSGSDGTTDVVVQISAYDEAGEATLTEKADDPDAKKVKIKKSGLAFQLDASLFTLNKRETAFLTLLVLGSFAEAQQSFLLKLLARSAWSNLGQLADYEGDLESG